MIAVEVTYLRATAFKLCIIIFRVDQLEGSLAPSLGLPLAVAWIRRATDDVARASRRAAAGLGVTGRALKLIGTDVTVEPE